MHPTMQQAFNILDEVVDVAPRAELVQIIGRLATLSALAHARLAAPPRPAATRAALSDGPADRLLKAGDAAAIASVPVKRVYEWARNQKWASRPTKRCLRIDERGFREWLRRRTS
jgi:hypothetical protein